MERSGGTDRAIELSGLTKVFPGHLSIGSTTAVSDLDLEVTRGESFGLLGPNGAGKTTTLKMMLGLLRPDRGTIRLLGLEPRDPAARCRIGFLPENPYFYDYLTAEEFLDFYGRLQGIPSAQRRDRVRETLRRVGLEGRGGTPLRKFSKGMIQRLGLAQAIQHEPDLLILDEPMSGLDPIGRREVRDLILSLRDEGKTIFFSSHILQDAEMICDRVAILKQGRLRSVGTLRELIGEKVRWFEVGIRGQLPEPCEAEVVSADGEGHLLRVPDVEALMRLLAEIQNGRARVVSIWPRRETLEDLFLREVQSGKEER
jgi:ABC-2 type transport system ATP-binding protein